MKTILIAAFFSFRSTVLGITLSLFGMMSTFAQDTTLPQGDCRIHLFSGKQIKHVRLWKIDPMKIEYVRDGNLGDVNVSEVENIDTKFFLITFDAQKKILKRHYDLIVPYYGDSIWCFIENLDTCRISYIERGTGRSKSVMKASVREYFQWPATGSFAPNVVPSAGGFYPARDMDFNKDSTPAGNDTALNVRKVSGVDSTGSGEEVISEQTARAPLGDTSDQQARIEKTPVRINVERKESVGESASYYHQSYQRGVRDAEMNYSGGWGAKAFFLGLFYGSPYVSSTAANSPDVCTYIPQGVDPQLYKDGYEQTSAMVKVKRATRGAAAAKGVVTAIIFMIIVF